MTDSAEHSPPERAFFFYTDIGKYTGKSAASLKEFAQKVKEVDEKSFRFHLQRGDLEDWISGVLKDEELAKQVKQLRAANLAGENLRDQLYSVVTARLDQLARTPAFKGISSTKTKIQWGMEVTR
jgi:benzoyl-CoA reductase/2-hydroxyglutaryl-CoA dehydratase subunit BcrC/BadD/HgdB